MLDMVRRRESDLPTTWGYWDSVRSLQDLMRWDPFRETRAGWEMANDLAPSFDVKETQDTYIFKADLPGVHEADLKVSIVGNRLTVSGKREMEEKHDGESFHTVERMHGSFTRSFSIPEGVDGDKVRAELREGVLTLTVPKKPEGRVRQVPVAVSR
jgi:HSP20 family protein